MGSCIDSHRTDEVKSDLLGCQNSPVHFVQGEEVIISSRVFVGNLSYDTSQRDLEALFSEVGNVVEVFLPADRATGRPRGFAFVELSDESAAAEAIEKFDGHEMGGRALRVTEAEDRPQRSGFSDSGGGNSPSGPPRGGKKARPKGSRRNIRSRKRSL